MARVLVVDDNEDNRTVLERMLQFGGHAVNCAQDGRQALESAPLLNPDVILMDLAMPGMDGWTATEKIKSRTDLQHIPVIVVTGHVTNDHLLRAQEVGCQDIVSKPVDYYVLLDKIAQHTQISRVGA